LGVTGLPQCREYTIIGLGSIVPFIFITMHSLPCIGRRNVNVLLPFPDVLGPAVGVSVQARLHDVIRKQTMLLLGQPEPALMFHSCNRWPLMVLE